MRFIVAIQVITAVLLTAAILLQSRGTGLGLAFGGEGNIYRTKRGLEKSLFRATIALAVVFLGSALVTTVINRPAAPPTEPDVAVPTRPAETAAPPATAPTESLSPAPAAPAATSPAAE